MGDHAPRTSFEQIRDATGVLLDRDLSGLSRDQLQELLDLIAAHPDAEPITRILIEKSSKELRELQQELTDS